MNFSRQALLGIGMILGGIVMLFALVQQLGASEEGASSAPSISAADSADADSSTLLTLDVDTEKRLLAQKQQQRELRAAEQEKQTQLFVEEQTSAESRALAQAYTENQRYSNQQNAKDDAKKKDSESSPSITEKNTTADPKPDVKKLAPKKAVDYSIKEGDRLSTLAQQYNVPVAVLAQANKIEPSATLQIGQVLTVPSRTQIEGLKKEAAAAEKIREEKRQKKAALARKTVEAKDKAEKKLVAARQEVKETDAKGSFGVQVALATNQESADKLAEKFKAAGYDVKTSKTDRGVRVVVGPERGKLAALALKDKVNSDPEVNTTSAWVLYW